VANGPAGTNGAAVASGGVPANAGVPASGAGVSAIADLSGARKATVEGRVRAVEIHPVENSCVFEAAVADETGAVTAKFYGRTNIPGFEPGARVRLTGKVSMPEGGPAMINPAYELLPRGE
jgi:RecG-like helicase